MGGNHSHLEIKPSVSLDTTDHLYVVGVVASAGGLEAISQLMSQFPTGIPQLALIIAPQVHAPQTQRLTDLLGRMSGRPVVSIQDGMALKAGYIYLAPPGKQVRVCQGHLTLSAPAYPLDPAPAADFLFESLAWEYGARAIGIVLSGVGQDGLAGSRLLRAQGGLLIAQDTHSARFPSMPSAVADAALADYCLPPTRMGQLVKLWLSTGREANVRDREVYFRAPLASILAALKLGPHLSSLGATLKQYPQLIPALLDRLHHRGCTLLVDYAAYVVAHPEEQTALRDLLMPARFFHTAASIDRLVPRLRQRVQQVAPGGTLRIWFAGCAHVEDAYTFAALVDHTLQQCEQPVEVKLFVTHPDAALMRTMRQIEYGDGDGLISASLASGFLPEGDVSLSKRHLQRLRQMLLFSCLDLLQHPPFMYIDLLVVEGPWPQDRPDAQARLLQALRHALAPRGELIWNDMDKHVATLSLMTERNDLPLYRWQGETPPLALLPSTNQAAYSSVSQGDLTMLTRGHPLPYVIISAAGQVCATNGEVAPFLTGPADTHDILALAHPSLVASFRLLLSALQAGNPFVHDVAPLRTPYGEIETRGHRWCCRLVMQPGPQEAQFKVSLEAISPQELPTSPGIRAIIPDQQLLLQIREGESHEQTLAEELEVSNEELQAVNERLHHTNAELRASVGELEAIHQELQKTHAALSAAHMALQESQANRWQSEEKLRQILAHTVQGFILIDRNFKIERINPAGTEILEQLSGRPLDLSHSMLDYFPADWLGALLPAIRAGFEGEVLQQVWQAETPGGTSMWLEIHLVPVRAEDGVPFRLNISLLDITAQRETANLLEKLSLVASRTHNGVMMAGPDGRLEWINEGFTRITGYTFAEVAGRRPSEFLQGKGTDPATRAFARQKVRDQAPVDFEILNYRQDGTPFWARVEITPLFDEAGSLQGYLGIQRDVTEEIAQREEISRQQVQLQTVLESTSDLIWAVDKDLRLLSFNSAYARIIRRLLNLDIESGDYLPHRDLPAPMRTFWEACYQKALKGRILREEYSLNFRDQVFHFEFILHPVREASGLVQGVSIFGRDITERRQAEEQLRQIGANLTALIDNTGDMILSVDAGYHLITFNQAYARQMQTRYGVTVQAGDCVIDFLPASRRATWQALIDRTIAGQPHSEIQEDVFGDITAYFALSLNPIVDNGTIIGCTIFSRDISEIKQAERDLFDSKQLLERLLGNAPVEIFAKNRNGQFTQVNPRFAAHFNRRPAELLGKTLAQLSPDPWTTQHTAREAQVFDEKRSMIFYEEVPHSSGQAHYQHILFPLFDSEGTVNGLGGITMDITEQRKAEASLRFHADILANVNDSVIVTDLKGRITYFNEGAERIFGYSQAEVLGQTTEFLYYDPPQAPFEQILQQILAQKTTESEFRCRHKAGHEVWAMVKTTVLTNEKGEQKGFVGVSKDIGPLRQAQAGLESLTERFQLATKAAGVGVWDWDLERNTILWDDRMFPLYGWPGGERYITYEEWRQAIVAEDRPRAEADIQAALDGKPYDTHFRIRWPDGQIRHIKTYAAVYRADDGRVRRMIGVNWDATETYVTQQRIYDIAERLRLATQSASIGVFEWSVLDQSLIWDDMMHDLFGVAKEDFAGDYEAWRQTLLPEDVAETERLLQVAIQTTGQFDHVFRIQHPSRGIRYIQATAHLERQPDGMPLRMVGVNWDITETKQVEEEIRRARDLAEEMLRLKSNFLANMSHEIRTPLNGILGVTSIMQEEEDLNQVRHMLNMLALSGRRLLTTLTGILELAKIEAERDEYALEDILLRDMVGEVVEALRPLAIQQHLDFRFLPHCESGRILADRRLLSQILSNIIGNALKFTDEGSVEVRLSCAVNFKGKPMIEIAVQDTGIGIDSRNLEKIFEPFKQESEGQARRFEGSGLGLSIAKKYTELLGGSIRVESQKGRGSTFFVYLPQIGDACK